MKLGASTKGFGGRESREVAELFSRCGISCTELYFCQSDIPGWKHNYCGKLTLPEKDSVKAALEEYLKRSVEVVSLGVYLNLWNGSDVQCYGALESFFEYCDIASEYGIKTLTTASGGSLVKYPTESFILRRNEKLLEGLSFVTTQAHKTGITIAISANFGEAVENYRDFLSLREKIERITGAVGTLKYAYCPTDSLDIKTEDIALCHIKEKGEKDRFFSHFGSCGTDYSHFTESFSGSDIPMILEYVNFENLAAVAENFRKIR